MAPSSGSSIDLIGTKSPSRGKITRPSRSLTTLPTPTVPSSLYPTRSHLLDSSLSPSGSPLRISHPVVLRTGLHQSGSPRLPAAPHLSSESDQLLARPAPSPEAKPRRECRPHWRFSLYPPTSHHLPPRSDPLRPNSHGASLRLSDHRHRPIPSWSPFPPLLSHSSCSIGVGNLSPCLECGISLRYPQLSGDSNSSSSSKNSELGGRRYLITPVLLKTCGRWCVDNSDPNTPIDKRYSVLVAIPLSEMTAPFAGNLCVFPGSHERVYDTLLERMKKVSHPPPYSLTN
jgi:hypothetical protein